jgi:hypothetical protein
MKMVPTEIGFKAMRGETLPTAEVEALWTSKLRAFRNRILAPKQGQLPVAAAEGEFDKSYGRHSQSLQRDQMSTTAFRLVLGVFVSGSCRIQRMQRRSLSVAQELGGTRRQMSPTRPSGV